MIYINELMLGVAAAGLTEVGSWTAETWIAVGTCATTAIAFLAGLAAVLQVREMAKTREAEARPYPAVFMEPHSDNPQLVDLVVKNFGRTSAHDIKVQFDPPLERSENDGATGPVETFDVLPVLVPSQEWRTLWDVGMMRMKVDLPKRYDVAVSFSTEGGETRTLSYVLDWSVYLGLRYRNRKTIHHAAEALQNISQSLENAMEPASGGLRVWNRDGEAKDDAKNEAWEAFKSNEELPWRGATVREEE